MLKSVFRKLLFAVIILFVGCGLFLIFSIFFNKLFYGYKERPYNHEVDFIFSNDNVHDLSPEYVYKIADRYAIYFINKGLSKFVIIESSNYLEISIDEISINEVKNIKPTEPKTYTLFYYPYFPVVEQVLNPKKSYFLNILIAGNYEVEKEIRTKKTLYLSGNFSSLSFSNTQNCSMISFPESKQNDVVVTKHNNKLYFIVQAREDKTLLDFLNPALLKDDG